MTNKTLTQRIGEFIRDKREAKEERKAIFNILRNNGYENRVFEGEFTNDINIFGRPNKYKTEYTFGKPLIENQYALVPVNRSDKYFGHESASLALVDRAKKKVTKLVNAGDRRIHYNGKCKIKPTAMHVRDDGKLIFSYRIILHADLKNPLTVSNSIWEDYLFRHTEDEVAQVELKDLEELK